MKRMLALSIKQPHVEQILRGIKKIEYRNMPTSKRGRVYVYASLRPADERYWKEIGLKPGVLPTGVVIGTVEIVDCVERGPKNFEWILSTPVRLKRPFKPGKHPQPSWFYPF